MATICHNEHRITITTKNKTPVMSTTMTTQVLYALRQDAKSVKVELEKNSFLDRRFRMFPANEEAVVAVVSSSSFSSLADPLTLSSPRLATSDSLEPSSLPSMPASVGKAERSTYNSIKSIRVGEDEVENKVKKDLYNLRQENNHESPVIIPGKFIAIPVTDECIQTFYQFLKRSHNFQRSSEVRRLRFDKVDGDGTADKVTLEVPDNHSKWATKIIASGMQPCPFSTSLGNRNQSQKIKVNNKPSMSSGSADTSDTSKNFYLTDVQNILLETLLSFCTPTPNGHYQNDRHVQPIEIVMTKSVAALSNRTCPKKLEIMGDDRTLVIPRWSFLLPKDQQSGEKLPTQKAQKGGCEFNDLLLTCIQLKESSGSGECSDKNSNNTKEIPNEIKHAFQSMLWQNLVTLYKSPRIVRRGDIDPESGVRESGHRILWPIPSPQDCVITGDCNLGFLLTPKKSISITGPTSPGWITITEHQISQSFDLTLVMFSRGNVTEKLRFGKLVQSEESVLDMYAGIGYYTLPALIHGKAKFVVACEWNPHAVRALRYNLKANKVGEGRVQVLEGDCRVMLRRIIEELDQKVASINSERASAEHDDIENSKNSETSKSVTDKKKPGKLSSPHIFLGFDRISLGLLPSSEGGWPTALSCLHIIHGGYLHVHANVPCVEQWGWVHWLCQTLVSVAQNIRGTEWIAVCVHLEKVKSFAPKVDHIVADVFVGPPDSPKMPLKDASADIDTGVLDSYGKFERTPLDVSPPSCALGNGVLNQKWLSVSDNGL